MFTRVKSELADSAAYSFIKQYPWLVLGGIAVLAVAIAFTAGGALVPGLFYAMSILGHIAASLAFAVGVHKLTTTPAFHQNPKSWRNTMLGLGAFFLLTMVIPMVAVFIGGVVTALALGYAAVNLGKFLGECLKNNIDKRENRNYQQRVAQAENNPENNLYPNPLNNGQINHLAARFPVNQDLQQQSINNPVAPVVPVGTTPINPATFFSFNDEYFNSRSSAGGNVELTGVNNTSNPGAPRNN